MKPLTVYIMPADKNEIPLAKIMESFGDVVEEFVLMPNRDLSESVKRCQTEWYMYVFSNEYLSEELMEALPLLMDQNDYEVFVIYERETINKVERKYGQSPRLFKSHIELNGMMPVLSDENVLQRAIDGFLER